MAYNFDWLLDFSPWGADGNGDSCEFALADFRARSGMIFGGDWQPHFVRWCERQPGDRPYRYSAENLEPKHGMAFIRVSRARNRPTRLSQ